MIIQQQEKSANSAARVRDAISEKRRSFDDLINHMHSIHDKQNLNLIASQERYYQTEKLLMEMETRSMKEEQKSAYAKNFQLRQNHKS
jgi:MinD-like ATPase involved in chromosome partitioning or flagellar assembly